jgi:anti-sigma B factor antagonist
MDISTSTLDGATVVTVHGEIDANTAPEAQERILPLASPGCRLVLDLTDVPYMSSAGLRILLATYRQISAGGGKVVLVGVAEEIKDTMSVTGFIKFFTLCDTLNEGVIALSV